jgi:voltage-gated potassium channel
MTISPTSLHRTESPVAEAKPVRGLARAHAWLHEAPATRGARLVQGSIQALIAVNIAALVAESVHSVGSEHAQIFAAIERFSIAVFSAEYLLRVASCVYDERYRRPVLGRLRYMVTPMALIDLLAIAPGLVPWTSTDLRGLRAARLMRIFRVLKLGRYSQAVRKLGAAVSSRREELGVTAYAMAILVTLAASVLYLAEREAQPEAFGSIPEAAWWALTTMTTVGYGDVVPITPLGKLAAAAVSVIGIGFFALPAAILGSAFVEQTRRERRCPHCGKGVSD